MRRAVLALTPFVLAACGWSLSGYSNGEDDKSGSDASADAANDTASGGDAPNDAGGGDDDATLPDGGRKSCANRPLSNTLLFCDDFDDVGEKIGAKWTGASTGSVGSATTSLSPPNALLSKLAMLTTQYGFARVTTPLKVPATAKAITYRFSLGVEQLGAISGGYLGLAAIVFTPSLCKTQGDNMNRYVSVTANSDGQLFLFGIGLGAECWTGMDDDALTGFSQVHLAGAQPPSWRNLALRASSERCPAASTGSSITLSVDGTAAACLQTVVDPMQKTQGASIELGIDNGNPWGDVTLDYDDVEVTTE